MPDFNAKMHQNRLLSVKPRWGSLQRSPIPPSWILRGLLLREGRGGEGRKRKGGEWEGMGREGEGEGMWRARKVVSPGARAGSRWACE